MAKHATGGTVISDTLRLPDLLTAFADALEALGGDIAEIAIAREYAKSGSIPDAYGSATEVLNILEAELDKLAPKNCYFGARFGDVTDFGFWPLNEINEI